MTAGAVIIGSGNIGTDLMMKVTRLSTRLHLSGMVGIDPESDGLARAHGLGVSTTHSGVEGMLALPGWADTRVVFDATSAAAHRDNAAAVAAAGKLMVDLTPAALGPYVVPAVNLDEHLTAPDVNMVTCGGQATIPIVAAVSRTAPVVYAEIIASIASRSAGPGTRANIDEFTETTARALEVVGGAAHGKAVIVLNPAEPPLVMRDTVYCLVESESQVDEAKIAESVDQMVADVHSYVPGYRLKQALQFDPVHVPYVSALGRAFRGVRVAAYLEVTGAAHYLPAYAGNLDIMTSAALRTAERLATLRDWA